MKRSDLVLAILIFVISVSPSWAKDRPTDGIAAMSFLAGSWSGPMWGGEFNAYYTTPVGGKVISYNVLRKDGEITFHEFEVFERSDGQVVFHPFPNGKRAVTLMLAEIDIEGRRVVFENPDKDFPTRIEYHRAADDRLVITLSDPHNQSDQEQVFDLRRVP